MNRHMHGEHLPMGMVWHASVHSARSHRIFIVLLMLSSAIIGVTGARAVWADGSWSTLAPIPDPHRTRSAAVRLPNGLVLLAGDFRSHLYDPQRNRWERTPLNVAPRRNLTATLLADGRVLLAGGQDPGTGQALNSSELYEGGTWRAAGDMTNERWGHTATLLPDGRVLVTGGRDSNIDDLSSCEIFDPTTGQWRAASSLANVRVGHTATLLADGRVLVAGGFVGIGSRTASAELYDPVIDRWSAAADMLEPQGGHTATMTMSGSVLTLGGGQIPANLYVPSSNSWRRAGNPASGRTNHTATRLDDGRVLVVGGESSDPLDSVEIYDPATGTWATTDRMANARAFHTAVLLPDGRVMAAGGFGDSFQTASIAEAFGLGPTRAQKTAAMTAITSIIMLDD